MPFPHEPSTEERNTAPTRVGARESTITPDYLRREKCKPASQRRWADVSSGALGSFQYNKSHSDNYALFPEILRALCKLRLLLPRPLASQSNHSESPLGVLTWIHRSPYFLILVKRQGNYCRSSLEMQLPAAAAAAAAAESIITMTTRAEIP